MMIFYGRDTAMIMKEKKVLDEPIEIVPYDPSWPAVYQHEAEQLKKVFSPERLIAIQHFGSTSVPGLHAKPVIDILVGLNECSILEQEKTVLEQLGYQYIGKVVLANRIYIRKRQGKNKVNLALVEYNGQLWHDNLTVRDYLRAHTQEADRYAVVKQEAIEQGISTLLAYADFKYPFVSELLKKARAWRSGSS
jgi:GrpB-like predicted nucleotidyltransferase (UPF0157 family)